MMNKKDLENLGQDVYGLVLSYREATREHPRQPAVTPWARGVFIAQGDDEVWLTDKQARRLIKDLQEYYPD